MQVVLHRRSRHQHRHHHQLAEGVVAVAFKAFEKIEEDPAINSILISRHRIVDPGRPHPPSRAAAHGRTQDFN